MRARQHQVKFRLNDEEYALLKKKLKGSPFNMATFFRRMLVGVPTNAEQLAIFRDIQKQVRGVGRNVNQITRLSHISGKLSAETLRDVAAAQERIESKLDQLKAAWQY